MKNILYILIILIIVLFCGCTVRYKMEIKSVPTQNLPCISCQNGDFHWGTTYKPILMQDSHYYRYHFPDDSPKDLTKECRSFCVRAWCNDCQKFVCVTRKRH